MANTQEKLISVAQQDYIWPYARPIVIRPLYPPMHVENPSYHPQNNIDDCNCDYIDAGESSAEESGDQKSELFEPSRKQDVKLENNHSLTNSKIAVCSTENKNTYKDPTKFQYSATENHLIEPAKKINLNLVPKIYKPWVGKMVGKSEYMRTISNNGLENLRNQQQYINSLTKN